jgi:hypothetical protein
MSRALAVVVVLLTGLLGFGLFLVPDRMAAALNSAGTDPFAFRSGGAAFIGYAAAFALAWTRPRAEAQILWLATLVGGIATVAAGLITIALGNGGGVVFPAILAGGVVVALAAQYELRGWRGLLPDATGRRFARWFVYFLGWGVIAAALFGIGGLVLGSVFGSLSGFAGNDDVVYRIAGAATVGILAGTLLSLRTQSWELVRLPVVLGFVTNVFSLMGGLIVLAAGGAPIMLVLIVGAAIFNVIGLGLALAGRH